MVWQISLIPNKMILTLVNINVRYFWSGNCLLLQATGCALYSFTPCGNVCPTSRPLPTLGVSCHIALTGDKTAFSLKLKGPVLPAQPLKRDIGVWLSLSQAVSPSSGAVDWKKQGQGRVDVVVAPAGFSPQRRQCGRMSWGTQHGRREPSDWLLGTTLA